MYSFLTFFSLVNRIVPKRNLIIFNSFPDYSDNAWSLYQYICRERKDLTRKYTILWAQDHKPTVTHGYRVNYVKKKSIRGIWCFLRASYIISTHGYFPNVRSGKGQVQVNLWHGCGYKDIPVKERYYRGDKTIVTGEIYRKLHSIVLSVPLREVYATGLPRNDRLFRPCHALKKAGIRREKWEKIYIWMPTYRKAAIGHHTVDGNVSGFGLGGLTKEEFGTLNQVLQRKGALLIIKPHPMDSVHVQELGEFSNILPLTHQELLARDIELYELLPETDCLLSDYSSVIIDYLIMNKPVVMTLSDMEEYRTSRGLLFDDMERYLPGPIISDMNSLLDYLEHADETDEKWRDKRKELQELFHKYPDGNSSKRVSDLIWGPRPDR